MIIENAKAQFDAFGDLPHPFLWDCVIGYNNWPFNLFSIDIGTALS